MFGITRRLLRTVGTSSSLKKRRLDERTLARLDSMRETKPLLFAGTAIDSDAEPEMAFQLLVVLAVLGPFAVFFVIPGAGLMTPNINLLCVLGCLAACSTLFAVAATLADDGSTAEFGVQHDAQRKSIA